MAATTIFKSTDEVKALMDKKNIKLVIYQNTVYDVTTYSVTHPGGQE